MTTITRIGFCERCYKANRPLTDQAFLVYGSKRGWHIRFARHTGYFGFTPHLYFLIKKVGQNIVYKERCAMHDCTLEIYWDVDQGKNDWQLYRGMWVRGMMSLASWNSLCVLKDLGYEV